MRQYEQFAKKANALIARLGAEPEGGRYPWRLMTVVGPLSLLVEENTLGGPGTVFTRFDNPPKAKTLVACNPFSGKWNHHFFEGWTVKVALEVLECQLRKILQ